MSDLFKYIVVGRGMMGSAAARHLSKVTDGVALIGPDEPAHPLQHDGVSPAIMTRRASPNDRFQPGLGNAGEPFNCALCRD